MRFYLGTHEVCWLDRVDYPLFISRRKLVERASYPTANHRWALDSGGFTELQMHGRWTVDAATYADEVRTYRDAIGRLDWAAPQDWMCEPWVLTGGTHGRVTFAGTGLTIAEHQQRTVDNLVELRELAPDLPFIPVLQGWELDDYLRCVELYADAGIDLTREATVGLGSVCRRQSSDEIEQIVTTLHALGLHNLHGFGVKTRGLSKYGHLLKSADSLAWSFAARYDPPLPGHDQPGPYRRKGHVTCANCHEYADRWRTRVLAKLARPRLVQTQLPLGI